MAKSRATVTPHDTKASDCPGRPTARAVTLGRRGLGASEARGAAEPREHWTGPQNLMTWHPCFSASSPDAHVVKGFLEQRGVPCLLRSEGPSMYPSAGLGARVHVLVPEDWLPVARQMVDRRRRAQPQRVVPIRRRRRPA